MIREEKYKNALYALHKVFVKARDMAYKNEDHKIIARLLDYAEILPEMIASENDETERFTRFIEAIVVAIPACEYILQGYNSDLSDRWK